MCCQTGIKKTVLLKKSSFALPGQKMSSSHIFGEKMKYMYANTIPSQNA